MSRSQPILYLVPPRRCCGGVLLAQAFSLDVLAYAALRHRWLFRLRASPGGVRNGEGVPLFTVEPDAVGKPGDLLDALPRDLFCSQKQGLLLIWYLLRSGVAGPPVG